jgi:phage repressor protein C with HTH and peptisase S24 domain
MDQMRELILSRMEQRGTNMTRVSRAIGQNSTYLFQFLKQGKPRKLPEDVRARLAAHLDIEEELLRSASPLIPAKQYVKNKGNPESSSIVSTTRHSMADAQRLPDALYGANDLPVFATAQAGSGALIVSSEPVDYVTRPAPLLRVKAGYGVIVSGDSMDPAIKSGAIALINPHLPPRNGDLCVLRSIAENGDVAVMIKELRRFTDDFWFLRQYNPPKDFSVKRSEWQTCHIAVGSYFPR